MDGPVTRHGTAQEWPHEIPALSHPRPRWRSRAACNRGTQTCRRWRSRRSLPGSVAIAGALPLIAATARSSRARLAAISACGRYPLAHVGHRASSASTRSCRDRRNQVRSCSIWASSLARRGAGNFFKKGKRGRPRPRGAQVHLAAENPHLRIGSL